MYSVPFFAKTTQTIDFQNFNNITKDIRMAPFSNQEYTTEPIIANDELLPDGKRYVRAVPQGGVCSQLIEVLIQDGEILQVRFTGGCSGNTQGVAALSEGATASNVAGRLCGISCGGNPTSCPDQLSKVLQYIIDNPK